MKYTIYIDESNTSGKKQEKDPEKLIAASWYLKNDELDDFAKRITNGHILKGTDLLTKDMNDVLELVMLNLERKNSWGIFMASTTFLTARERTFDLFYFSFKHEWEGVEWIRQKIMAYVCDEPTLSFFESKISTLSKNDVDKLRYELLCFMRQSSAFSNNEIEKIENHFNRIKITNTEIHNQNNHSSIIGSAIISAIETINMRDGDELEIIIDDFKFEETKAMIDFEMSILKKRLPKIKYIVAYESDKEIISLQIADWVASIYRKSCENIYKILSAAKKEKTTLDMKSDIFIFHSKIMKSLWQYSQNTNIQVSPWFLSAFELISTSDISDYAELKIQIQELMKKKYNDKHFQEMLRHTIADIEIASTNIEEYFSSLVNGNNFHKLELEKNLEEANQEFLRANPTSEAKEWLKMQNDVELFEKGFKQNNKK